MNLKLICISLTLISILILSAIIPVLKLERRVKSQTPGLTQQAVVVEFYINVARNLLNLIINITVSLNITLPPELNATLTRAQILLNESIAAYNAGNLTLALSKAKEAVRLLHVVLVHINKMPMLKKTLPTLPANVTALTYKRAQGLREEILRLEAYVSTLLTVNGTDKDLLLEAKTLLDQALEALNAGNVSLAARLKANATRLIAKATLDLKRKAHIVLNRTLTIFINKCICKLKETLNTTLEASELLNVTKTIANITEAEKLGRELGLLRKKLNLELKLLVKLAKTNITKIFKWYVKHGRKFLNKVEVEYPLNITEISNKIIVTIQKTLVNITKTLEVDITLPSLTIKEQIELLKELVKHRKFKEAASKLKELNRQLKELLKEYRERMKEIREEIKKRKRGFGRP